MEHVISVLKKEETRLSNKIAKMTKGKSQSEAKRKRHEVKDAIRLLSSKTIVNFDFQRGYRQGMIDAAKMVTENMIQEKGTPFIGVD